MPESLIPPHGGYRELKSFQCAAIVYDATVAFCDRFIEKRSRTHDQMVQAARQAHVRQVLAGVGCDPSTQDLRLLPPCLRVPLPGRGFRLE